MEGSVLFNLSITGERIKKKREEKRFTQGQLAKLVNKSKQVISNWERGYSKPVDDDLSSLSSALDVSADYLLGQDGFTPAATQKESVKERKAAAMATIAERHGFDITKEEDYIILEQLFETAAKIRGYKILDK